MRISFFIVVAMMLTSPALADPAIPYRDMIAGAIDGYARPHFAALAITTGTLRDDVTALCATPSGTALQTAQGDFKAAALAYSSVEFLQIGPLGVGDRAQRLLFWPDVKGIALRQVQTALSSSDPSASATDTLKGKSVAVQGLAAVEYLLFGTGFDDLASAAGAYRCRYAAAATTLIADVASTVSTEWADATPAGAAAGMLDPKPDSADYRTPLEVVNKLAGALALGTDTIRDQRISPILSLTTGEPKPRLGLFWRSGLTAASLGADFTGLRDFFHAAKFPEAMGDRYAWIAQGADYEFKTDIAAAASITDPLDKAVTVPAELLALKQMHVSTQSLDTLLGDNLGAALGLSTGFSALDSD